MWLCKVWNHSWKYVGDIRTCKRCGEVEDFLGFKLELNRTDLRAIAYDRAVKKTYKEDWPLLVIGVLSIFGLAMPDAVWAGVLVIIISLVGGGALFYVLNKRTKEALEALMKESEK